MVYRTIYTSIPIRCVPTNRSVLNKLSRLYHTYIIIVYIYIYIYTVILLLRYIITYDSTHFQPSHWWRPSSLTQSCHIRVLSYKIPLRFINYNNIFLVVVSPVAGPVTPRCSIIAVPPPTTTAIGINHKYSYIHTTYVRTYNTARAYCRYRLGVVL
jgi:hypothetical protein